MTSVESARDDRADSLRHILRRRGSSLVSELLAIQQHAQPVKKSHKWAANPLCLWYCRSSPTCFILEPNPKLELDFVAVSWTWEPSIHEDTTAGKYSATYNGNSKMLDVRNSALDRIVKYLESVNIRGVWIDRVCIDQDDIAKKEMALNSMDLIYRKATKSVGLLTTPIRTSYGRQRIESMIRGKWSVTKEDYHDAITTIQILHDLTKDMWWTRAWIFQEEYVSGLKMDLLIPLADGAQDSSKCYAMGGELSIKATAFRERATEFLLAYLGTPWKPFRKSCHAMLHVIGKYNILLSHERSGLQSMSAKISADIGKRDVTNPWDVLAITANACDYETRLDKVSRSKKNLSLSLSLLAQYLLNGEILAVGSKKWSGGYDCLDVTVATFLYQTTIQDQSLPFEPRRLSFSKNCRLPSLRFCAQGLRTFGFVWKLRKIHRIHTRDWKQRYGLWKQETSPEKEVWETEELNVLACELQRHHQALAIKLRAYMDNRRRGWKSLAAFYMDRMLWKIVDAIKRSHVLRVGYLEEGGAGAIFIPRRKDVSESIHAFTAWQPGCSDFNDLDNFVSLEVAVRNNGTLRIVRWMNGLAFFPGLEPKLVVFGWPDSWKKIE